MTQQQPEEKATRPMTVMATVFKVVEATDEVDALTQFKDAMDGDCTIQSVQVLRGQQHFA